MLQPNYVDWVLTGARGNRVEERNGGSAGVLSEHGGRERERRQGENRNRVWQGYLDGG